LKELLYDLLPPWSALALTRHGPRIAVIIE
jgi:hypothetical protein